MTVLVGKVRGLKQLEDSLAELSRKYSDPKIAQKALRPALKKATDEMLAEVKANVPVRTGFLKSTVKRRIKKPSKKEGRAFVKDTIMAVFIGYRGKGLFKRATAVEYGNRITKSNPILRTAFDNNHSSATVIFRRELRNSIEKLAKKLNKKPK